MQEKNKPITEVLYLDPEDLKQSNSDGEEREREPCSPHKEFTGCISSPPPSTAPPNPHPWPTMPNSFAVFCFRRRVIKNLILVGTIIMLVA